MHETSGRPAGRAEHSPRTPDPQRRPATVSPSGCLRWLQATRAPTGGWGHRFSAAGAAGRGPSNIYGPVHRQKSGSSARARSELHRHGSRSAPAAQPRCASERSAAACRKGGGGETTFVASSSAQHHSRPSFSSSVPWPLPPSNWCCLAATSTRPHHLLALRDLFPYRDGRRRLST